MCSVRPINQSIELTLNATAIPTSQAIYCLLVRTLLPTCVTEEVKTSTGGYKKFLSQGLNHDYLPTWLNEGGINSYYVGKFLNDYSIDDYQDVQAPGWTGSKYAHCGLEFSL